MDARPHRAFRRPAVQNDENLAPSAKTIHQRNKSATLLNQPTLGTLQAAAKRSAFADKSNISNPIIFRDEPKMNKGESSEMVAVTMVVKAKENDTLAHGTSKDALSRPAQRPSSKGASFFPTATNGYIKPLHGGVTDSHLPSIKPTAAKRASTIVYNDNHKDRQLSGQFRPSYEISESVPLEELAGTRQPRHHQGQPVLQFEKSLGRKSSYLEDLRELQGLQDEITEEKYTDAHEELPLENDPRHQSGPNGEWPVAIAFPSNKGPLIPVPSLPEPVHDSTANAKSTDASQNLMLHGQSEAPAEFSDYEEDEDDYEQGYTTAHSYRSRGENTTGGATTEAMLPPKATHKALAEVEAAKAYVESTRSQEEIDEETWDISMVAEYGEEIFSYMKELEINLRPNPHYMDIQTEIQWSMRGVLMDWVIQVHGRFGLLPETLFLTVNYIDRFLSYKIVSLGKLQLVGATAIFVAAKYEEINCPSVQEIVYMVDTGYTVDEILKAERFMLSMLNFELGWPGPMSFLRRISKADDYDLETRTLAKYFLEVTIMDERFVATPPSYIAAGAHCLSRLILGKGTWTMDHVHYSGYTFKQLQPLVAILHDCCRNALVHHNAVYEKYCDKRYKRAAHYVQAELRKGFSLPFQQSITHSMPFESYDDISSRDPYAAPRPLLKMPIPSQG